VGGAAGGRAIGSTASSRDRTLVIAASLGRWAAVLHAVALPPARPDGLGAAFDPRPAAVLAATVLAAATVALEPIPALAGLLVALEPIPALASLLAAIIAASVTSVAAVRVLGGRTGDTLGAAVALTEVVVRVVLLGFAR
jgi:adenosylcobinamide-GDP ribazoletransferase